MANPALTGVVALDGAMPGHGTEAGAGQGQSEAGTSGARCDLQVVDTGLIVGPANGTDHGVPALVPWSDVVAIRADDVAEQAGGVSGQLLEVELDDDELLGGGSTHRFLVPAADVGAFLLAASSVRDMTADADSIAPDSATGTPSGPAAVVALRALASKCTGDRPLGHGDPQHGLGRRRLGPIVVGLLALILLSGSTITTLGSRAGGASGPPPSHFADNGNEAQALQAHPISQVAGGHQRTGTGATIPGRLASAPVP